MGFGEANIGGSPDGEPGRILMMRVAFVKGWEKVPYGYALAMWSNPLRA